MGKRADIICVHVARGIGKLEPVMGPSGTGMDTLRGLARAACDDDSSIVLARRVVT